MTILIFSIRLFFGLLIGIFGIGLIAENEPTAAAICLAITAGALFPPKFKVRGQANVVASGISARHYFTGPLILAGIRWTFGLIYTLGAAAGIMEKEADQAIPVLLMGLIFITPLDRLVFPQLRFPVNMKTRQQSTAIIIVRNLGVTLHIYAAAYYFQNALTTANILAGLAFGCLLIATIVTPRRLIVPRPVAPGFSIWKLKFKDPQEDKPIFQHYEVETGVSPKLQTPPGDITTLGFNEKKEKLRRYTNAYKIGWVTTLHVTEEKFNGWIKNFQADWLRANKYHYRLNLHRNPNEFKNQVITELNHYIQQIRERYEMKIHNKEKMKVECIPDLVSDLWLGDKQLRSLYNALVKYAAQPKAKQMAVIVAHIAEYRAMINLVKRIKQSQLAAARKQLTQSNQAAPTLSLEQLAALNDETYFKIIDYIILMGKNLENYKELNEQFDEELFRDYFLTPLNTMSPHYAAKGEVFNRKGKTDILIFDKKGNNIFIAECKCWNGTAYLIGGVDQLLNTYVNWRDEKAAIIVFNKTVKKFSELIQTATEALSAHPLCVKPGEKRTDTSWSFWFRNPDDEQRSIRLELILFNFA